MNSIEKLIQSNRAILLESWVGEECRADLMFAEVSKRSRLFVDSSYKRLESLAKILLQFLRNRHDRQAMVRMLPSLRAYREGRRDAKQLQVLLMHEIQGVLLEDAVKLGIERGLFEDIGHAINLTPDQDFETLYPKL